MKKLVQGAAIAVLFSFSSYVAAADLNIATIDMRAVFQQLSQSGSVSQKLKDEFAEPIRELKKLEGEIKTTYEKRERDKSLLSESELTQLNRQLEAMQAEYQLKAKNFEDDKRARTAEEQQKIMVKVQDAVEAVASSKGYDLVLPIDTTAFAKAELDISRLVIDAASKRN